MNDEIEEDRGWEPAHPIRFALTLIAIGLVGLVVEMVRAWS